MPPKRATKCKNCPNPPMPARATCRQCHNAQMREYRHKGKVSKEKMASVTTDGLRNLLLGNLLRLLERDAGASSIQEAYDLAAQAGALPAEEGTGVPLGIRIEGLRTLIPELPELADMANLMLQRRIVDADEVG